MNAPFPLLLSVFTDPSCDCLEDKNLALVSSISLVSSIEIEIE